MLRSDVQNHRALTTDEEPARRGAAGPWDVDAPPPDPDDLLRLVSPDGTRLTTPVLDRWVADVDLETLVGLYDDMVVARRFDDEAVALQRQGQLGLWPPLKGQEAAQVGSARALRPDDFVFSSYRENAVAYCRGASPADLLRVWRGTALTGWDPHAIGMATPQIVVGSHALHATGYAIGCRIAGTDQVTVAYFGDGATSKGDVHEAMVFAASQAAPVVFFCQNNGWAISEPVALQARRPLADRAPGYGIPSMRIDGNDVLAVLAATRMAVDRARHGEGPTFVEAVTYRRGPHTTSDDPTRYEDRALAERWAAQDPITRVERLLQARGALPDERAAAIRQKAETFAERLRTECYALPEPEPSAMFDHVLVEPTATLDRQRHELAAYREMFDE